MAQKKPAAKKAAAKKPANKTPSAKRARNKDGTYKGDDESTPDVNEAYEQPKAGTKATTKPRNPVAKQRASETPKKPAAKKPAAKKAPAKKPAAKKPHTYAPKVQSPVEEMLEATRLISPAKVEDLWRSTPTAVKKSRVARAWSWLVGE